MQTTLILGPPGTGKTTALLDIVEKYLDKGIDSRKIAFIAFTKKAAAEAKVRAKKKFSLSDNDLVNFRTLHSLCYRETGITHNTMLRKKHYKAMSEDLGMKFTGFINPEGPEAYTSEPDQFLYLNGLARTKIKPLKEIWSKYGEDSNWHKLKYFNTYYNRFKKEHGLFDFTDQLEKALKECSPLNLEVVIIDEAQDLSFLQWSVIDKLFRDVPFKYIAGDDDQTIFKWSGADIVYFLHLQGIQQILKTSHRVPEEVFNLSTLITAQIKQRYSKDYYPKKVKGEVSYFNYPDTIDFSGTETWFILARNRFLLHSMEDVVKSQGLHYSISGNNSISVEDAKAIYAWTRLTKGAEINYIDAKLIESRMASGPPFKEKDYYMLNDFTYSPHTVYDWHDALDNIPVSKREYYRAILRRGGNLIKTPRIQLSTIHGVKGGEADNVVILSDMSRRTYNAFLNDPDNEHRVFYVGVTRAKNKLNIINPQTQFYYPFP